MGSLFAGWQEQRGSPVKDTAQNVFRHALFAAMGPANPKGDHPVCRATSRLDAGVSSDGLLVHAAVPAAAPARLSDDPEALLAAVNAELPSGMLVRRVALKAAGQVYVQEVSTSKLYSYYLRVGGFQCRELGRIGGGALFCCGLHEATPEEEEERATAAAGAVVAGGGGGAGAADPLATPPRLPPSDGRWYGDTGAFVAALRAAIAPAVGDHDFKALSNGRSGALARSRARGAEPPRGTTVRRVLSVDVVPCGAEDLLGRAARIVELRRRSAERAASLVGREGEGEGGAGAGAAAADEDDDEDGPRAAKAPRLEGRDAAPGTAPGAAPDAAPDAARAGDAPGEVPPSSSSSSSSSSAAGGSGASDGDAGPPPADAIPLSKRGRRRGFRGIVDNPTAEPARLVRVDVRVKGALKHMVRHLVGAAAAQVTGRLPRGSVAAALANPAAFSAGLGAAIPAKPLWLASVETSVKDLFGPPSACVESVPGAC